MTKLPPTARLRPTDSRPDAELLDRFATAGDEAAFAELVRRYGGLVWAVCRRLTPDRHAAEDAFQATFFVLVRRAGSVQRASAASFLHGVARRVSARCRGRVTDPLVETPTTDADPLAIAMQREEADALHAELARLPAGCREVLLLCDLGRLTRAETADRLGWSEGSVKGRLERGRKLLAARLAKRGITAGLVAASTAPSELTASVCRSATAVWLGEPLPAGIAGLVRAGVPWGVGKVVAGLLVAGLVMTVSAFARPADPLAPPLDPRGVLQEAEAALDRVSDRESARIRAGYHIADAYTRLGDAAAARARLNDCLATAARKSPRDNSEVVLPACVYARLGDAATVRWLVATVPAELEHNREQIARNASLAAAEAGHAEVADRIADVIPSERERIWCRQLNQAQRAMSLARRGDATAVEVALALPVQSRIIAVVGRLTWEWPTALDDPAPPIGPGIAAIRARAGDRPGAIAAIDRLIESARLTPEPNQSQPVLTLITQRYERDRNSILCAASAAAARLGDRPTARRLFDLIVANPDSTSWELDRRAALKTLAAAEAAAGNDREAYRLSEEVSGYNQCAVLSAVGLVQTRAGRRVEADVTFDRAEVTGRSHADSGLFPLTMSLALAGRFERAEQVWAGRPEAEPFHHWDTVGRMLARCGDIDLARAVCQTRITDPRQRMSVEWAIAAAQARTGKAADARRTADAEPDPLHRAYLLAGLAAGLLGDPD